MDIHASVTTLFRGLHGRVVGPLGTTEKRQPSDAFNRRLREILDTRKRKLDSSKMSLDFRFRLLSSQLRALIALKDPKTKELITEMRTHLSWVRTFLHYVGINGIQQKLEQELHAAEVNLSFAYINLLFSYLGEENTRHILSAPFGYDNEEERNTSIRENGLRGFAIFFAAALAQRLSALVLVNSIYARLTLETCKEVLPCYRQDVICMRQMLEWIERTPFLYDAFESIWKEVKPKWPLSRVKAAIRDAEAILAQRVE